MAEELLVNIVGDASKLKGALDSASGQVSSFSEKIGKIGKIATVGGVAITAAFTKAFLNFTAYETKLIDMAKVTSEPFDQIEAKLGTINPVLGTSTELMEGYYQVISAGVKDPVRALETLTIAAKAGKAAHVAQSEVVKGITKMMAGYEGAIRNASEAADLLFAIEKEGQTTVAELIPVIGGLAKVSFDLNIKQTAMAASMAVISKTAGSTAEAATQYEAVLTGLLKPTEDMTAAIEDMGYATAQQAIEDEGLVEVLKHLEEYMDRTGVSAAKLFGRKEAMLGFSALGAEGFKVLDDTIISVGESAGGAEKAFLNWSESGAAAIDEIKNTFANFVVSIGEKVAPMIKNVLGTVTDVITKIMKWADENEELTEKLFTWGLALGAALAVLGPIAVLLPSLITGVTLLSGAFLPFAVTAGIVLGIAKLTQYLNEMNKAVYETQIRLSELTLAEIDAEIVSLSEEASVLQYELSKVKELPLSHKFVKDYENAIENLNMKIGMLIEQREKLTKAEEEGIDVTEEKLELDEETKKLMDELAKKEEEAKKALKEKAKTAELVNAQMKIENEIYALTHTAMEVAIRDLDLQKQAYLDAGIEMGIVNSWYELQTKSLEGLNEKQEEHIGIMEEVAKVTKAVEDRWFELIKLPYEVKIKNINEKYDDYIKVIKESNLSLLAQETAIRNTNLTRDAELAKVDKVTEAEKKAKKQKDILIDAYKELEDRIYELTHDEIAYNIKKLGEQKQAYIALGVSIDVVMKWYDAEILKLGEVGDAFTGFEKIAKDAITKVTGYIVDNLSPAIENLLFGMEDFEWEWEDFWSGLWDVLKKYISNMITKLLIAIPLMLVWGALTGGLSWTTFWQVWGFLGFEKGGGVGYNKGGEVKGFQAGGVADTIPARLTVGEYVIAKPMTDFIKRFKAIPQNLVDAVVRGLPTPAPAFAIGGPVGTPNITTSSFGETKIYVDIHDNKISDEIDVKRLAITISDEILRKINGNRRH